MHKLRHNKLIKRGAYLLCSLVLLCALGPTVVGNFHGYTFETQNLMYGAQAPSFQHWFGTDFHGRDLFVRVLCGGQISLAVGFFAAIISMFVGVLYGAISGYTGGHIDALMMRIVDVLYALPYMFMVIILVTICGKHMVFLLVALSAVGWLMTARIVRGQVRHLTQREFVLAAQAMGTRPWRMIMQHLLPNTSGPIIVYFTLSVPSMIMQEAFLSFLGLGVQAPHPSLGSLISDGAAHMTVFWWELVYPSSLMALLLLSLYMIGDGLQDELE